MAAKSAKCLELTRMDSKVARLKILMLRVAHRDVTNQNTSGSEERTDRTQWLRSSAPQKLKRLKLLKGTSGQDYHQYYQQLDYRKGCPVIRRIGTTRFLPFKRFVGQIFLPSPPKNASVCPNRWKLHIRKTQNISGTAYKHCTHTTLHEIQTHSVTLMQYVGKDYSWT